MTYDCCLCIHTDVDVPQVLVLLSLYRKVLDGDLFVSHNHMYRSYCFPRSSYTLKERPSVRIRVA